MKKFTANDIFFNTIKTYPKCAFQIYDRKIYYNNKTAVSGVHTGHVGPTATGKISLYEMNVDRPSGQMIYPFITKEGSQEAFQTVTPNDYHTDFQYGDIITGSYPLEANISRDRFALGQERRQLDALRNSLNRNKRLSLHYAYDAASSLGDKTTQELSLISVPSIYYGSNIKKGSVRLKFYITGSLIAEAWDIMRNGELIQTYGAHGTGSVAGVVLYNEGFMILTGNVDLSGGENTQVYTPGAAAHGPRWLDFASTGSTGAGENLPNTVYTMEFNGVNPVPVLTMFCAMDRGEYNYSNNPTYLSSGQGTRMDPITSSREYIEADDMVIKNVAHSSYADPTGSFEKITYVEKVALYDEHKNLIGVVKLAKPLRKRENDEYTFKIKIDY